MTSAARQILFLCPHNASLGPMAEAFVRSRGAGAVAAVSAATGEPGALHPMTLRVMAEAGIDLSDHTPTGIPAILDRVFDVVVGTAGPAAARPLLPGLPHEVDWHLADPSEIRGDADAVLAAFRAARDQVRRLVDDLLDRGYLTAFSDASARSNRFLDGMREGIIAHDEKRRIVYMNAAAERLTGCPRSEALNRDCHDVFPGNLCGGKCLFCDEQPPDSQEWRRELDIASRDGERHRVDTIVRPLLTAEGTRRGMLVSFLDISRERTLERRVGDIHQFSGIIGRDPKMLELYDLIHELAESNVPVLIQGESGTGKELVAAAIHNEGPRANRQFVAVNCGALPESLLESELFGHVKGAFTGALRDKKGRFELADGGTIFLDEIGDISPTMQVKLLRVLQEGRFERVGSERTLQVNVRVISASNRDVARELSSGRFREDLYYRLNVVPIFLPPLRERRADIPLLAEHLLGRILSESGHPPATLAPETLDILMAYPWPGNVRELHNWLQFALVKCKGDVILPAHLPSWVRSVEHPGSGPRPPFPPAEPAGVDSRRRLDAEGVRSALQRAGRNKVAAARLLRVSRATLYRFLDRESRTNGERRDARQHEEAEGEEHGQGSENR